jgi:hypothetical protein
MHSRAPLSTRIPHCNPWASLLTLISPFSWQSGPLSPIAPNTALGPLQRQPRVRRRHGCRRRFSHPVRAENSLERPPHHQRKAHRASRPTDVIGRASKHDIVVKSVERRAIVVGRGLSRRAVVCAFQKTSLEQLLPCRVGFDEWRTRWIINASTIIATAVHRHTQSIRCLECTPVARNTAISVKKTKIGGGNSGLHVRHVAYPSTIDHLLPLEYSTKQEADDHQDRRNFDE